MTLNMAQCFLDKAEDQPHHPLVLGPEEEATTSYGEFRAEVRRLAEMLREAGVKTGDNLGVLHPSGKDYIAFVYAIWACGACATPLPMELTPAEKRRIFRYIHIDAVIVSTRLIDQVKDSVRESIVPITNQAVYAEARIACDAPPQLAGVNPAFVRFTSGTTGDSKGVVLSHDSIYERIQAANQVLHIGESDRILWLLSMDYHFTVSIVAYLTFGASIVLPRNNFGVTLLTAAVRHKASLIYGSPTHYSLMVQDDTGAVLPDELRLAIVTTTALRPEIADAFYARFGRVLNETYGIIELGLPAINVSNLRAKQGSVGKVLPAYDLLLDCQPEEAVGEPVGEIALRAKGMLDAYYSPWKSRDAILEQNHGWFRTGDLGRLDKDGFLYIVGRTKEIISVGGMKFFPDEVESVLEGHPAIRAACVVGVQHKQWGETPVAQLVLKEGNAAPHEKDLTAYCGQFLVAHKIPASFRWVERLSYTASGKKIRNPDKVAQLLER